MTAPDNKEPRLGSNQVEASWEKEAPTQATSTGTRRRLSTKRGVHDCDWCCRTIREMWIDCTGAWQECVPLHQQKAYICRPCFNEIPGVREFFKRRSEKKLTQDQIASLKELGIDLEGLPAGGAK